MTLIICGVVVRVARRGILFFRDEGGEERDQEGHVTWLDGTPMWDPLTCQLTSTRDDI